MRLFKKRKAKKQTEFYSQERFFRFINQQMYGDLNNEVLIADRFFKDNGYYPNIENPKTFNEKVLWLTQYYQNPLTTLCADKYRVKDYIKEQLGEGYTVPTIATYNNVYEIDLDTLPKQFVLKVNWGWGGNQVIVVKDKSKVNIDDIRAKIDTWVQPWNNFYYISYDWGYKHMKPQIYAEQYMEQNGTELIDYKVYCFNGKPEMVLVITDRFGKKEITKTFFDTSWNLLNVSRPNVNVDKNIKMPECLPQMLEISKKLSKPFPLVRIDFYVVNNNPVIGEMTFHPGSSFETFEPKDWDYKLGYMLTLPEKMITDI